MDERTPNPIKPYIPMPAASSGNSIDVQQASSTDSEEPNQQFSSQQSDPPIVPAIAPKPYENQLEFAVKPQSQNQSRENLPQSPQGSPTLEYTPKVTHLERNFTAQKVVELPRKTFRSTQNINLSQTNEADEDYEEARVDTENDRVVHI